MKLIWVKKKRQNELLLKSASKWHKLRKIMKIINGYNVGRKPVKMASGRLMNKYKLNVVERRRKLDGWVSALKLDGNYYTIPKWKPRTGMVNKRFTKYNRNLNNKRLRKW